MTGHLRTVIAEPLSEEAFCPFGEIVEVAAAGVVQTINAGTCLKHASAVQLDYEAEGGRAALHIYHVRPLPLPIRIERFERHNLGSQTFLPLNGNPYLVVVAPPGEFSIGAVRVFEASGTQGVTYRRGTWHHFCLALDAESRFVVIDREGDGVDCDEIALLPSERFAIDVPPTTMARCNDEERHSPKTA